MNGPTRSRPPDLRQPPGSGAGGNPRRAGDERPREARNGHASDGRTIGGAQAPSPRRLSGSAAVEHAKSHLTEFTGQPCEGVSSLLRTREGWRVVLEVLELE